MYVKNSCANAIYTMYVCFQRTVCDITRVEAGQSVLFPGDKPPWSHLACCLFPGGKPPWSHLAAGNKHSLTQAAAAHAKATAVTQPMFAKCMLLPICCTV